MFWFGDPVLRLRKKYDRLREKAVSAHATEELYMLDEIETKIAQLEEGAVPAGERKETIRFLGMELKAVEKRLKSGGRNLPKE